MSVSFGRHFELSKMLPLAVVSGVRVAATVSLFRKSAPAVLSLSYGDCAAAELGSWTEFKANLLVLGTQKQNQRGGGEDW